MVLTAETDRASGYSSARRELQDLAAQVGVATTPLRPAGRARFGEEVIDVVTEGDFIATGAQVEVIDVVGARVIVQERPRGVDGGS